MDELFDHHALGAFRRRALRGGDAGARFLMDAAVEDLSDRLAVVGKSLGPAAAIHCSTADAARAIRASGKAGEVFRVEADADLLDGDGLVAPAEEVPLEPASLGLAVSLYALHAVNDVPGMLVQIRRALRPDGLFLGCMAGAGTLAELREALIAAEVELTGGAAARVHPFADVRDVGALLQRAGFALPVADIETVTVRYGSMLSLISDLRAMGATNALAGRSRRPASRELFVRAAQIYAERFADSDGRLRATFSTIWMSGWAPDPSQRKPLKPGSAAVSLADVLGRPPKAEP